MKLNKRQQISESRQIYIRYEFFVLRVIWFLPNIHIAQLIDTSADKQRFETAVMTQRYITATTKMFRNVS